MPSPFDQLTNEIMKLTEDNVKTAVSSVLRDIGNQLLSLSEKYGPGKRRGRKPADKAGEDAKADVKEDEKQVRRRGRKPRQKAQEPVQAPEAPEDPKAKTAGRSKRTVVARSVYDLGVEDDR